MVLKFYPAKHDSLFIWFWQHVSSWELKTKVKLNILPNEIETLSSISPKIGLILVANHSDELDPRIIMELSRLSSRRFTFMVNSEVFKEWLGLATFCLQHIGAFSVERGAADEQARRAAIDTVKKTNNVLVIFPEGEIFNLNDSVQPFKTGAAHIGLEALKEIRAEASDKSVSVLPIAIKYRYQKNISSALKRRILRMEKHLSMHLNPSGMRDELYKIMNNLWLSSLRATRSNPPAQAASLDIKTIEELTIQLQQTRETIVSEIEKKYIHPDDSQGDLLGRAQKMTAFLREQIAQKKFFTKETQKQLEEDLKAIRKTIQMATWQPQYIERNPSQERLAETVIKLERVVFDIKRPALFGKREAFVRILDPLDLSSSLQAYEEDPTTAAKIVVEELRAKIQKVILDIK